jgi:hypothetical protein
VFVRFRSAQKLVGEVYRSRFVFLIVPIIYSSRADETTGFSVKDWLHGVRHAAPDQETQRSLDKEPLTDAERLRIVHSLLTLPESEGGAGITPGKGRWTLVEGIFPLHDHEFNKRWMKRWSTTWTVSPEELGNIRDMFGEKVLDYVTLNRHPSLTLLPDSLLLCFLAIVFLVLGNRGLLRRCGLFPFAPVFTGLCCSQLPLVCCLRRAVEASGNRPRCTLECS